jgi:hypothetical protein
MAFVVLTVVALYVSASGGLGPFLADMKSVIQRRAEVVNIVIMGAIWFGAGVVLMLLLFRRRRRR